MRILFIAALSLLIAFLPQAAEAGEGDAVIVLHGIARSASSMQTLADRLQKRGFDVLNVDYASTTYLLDELVEKIHPEIELFLKHKTGKVHFVGYSMGGLLARAYIAKHKPAQMGRLVMIGTPNQGSEVANFLRDNWAYRKVYGPAGQQLTTDSDYMKKIGKPDYEFGVIAGDRSIDPASSYLIPGSDDGKVSIASTHLAGEKDHIVLHTNHLAMPQNFAVAVQTAHFLTYGFFTRDGLGVKPKPADTYNR